jgi:hypothetical protein
LPAWTGGIGAKFTAVTGDVLRMPTSLHFVRQFFKASVAKRAGSSYSLQMPYKIGF